MKTHILLADGGDKVNILQFRKKAGLTQKQLAEMVEVDQAAVSNWELGKSEPQRKTVPKIANALGCTVDELLSEAPTE